MHEGTMFEFASAREAVAAADALRALGAGELEAYTPFAVPALEEKLGIARTRIPWAVLAAALVGCVVAFGILWGTNAYDYPLDVGGRPLNSLPADIPIVFETTVLFGAVTAFLACLLRSGMPRLHRPVFEIEGIASATLDHFWIGVAHAGPLDANVGARMRELGALSVRPTKGEP